MSILCYCKKCGRIVMCDEPDEQCDNCFSELYIVPDEYLGGESKLFIKKDLKEQFINEYIKSSPEFDQNLFDHRDEDLRRMRMEYKAKLEHGRAVLEGRDRGNRYGIECPYCHATNISKIGFFDRFISTEVWGLGSEKIGKNFHCDHCGAYF